MPPSRGGRGDEDFTSCQLMKPNRTKILFVVKSTLIVLPLWDSYKPDTAIQIKPKSNSRLCLVGKECTVCNGQSSAEHSFVLIRSLLLHSEHSQQVDCNPVSLIKPYSQRGCWAFRLSHVQWGEPLRKTVLNINHNKRRFFPPFILPSSVSLFPSFFEAVTVQ